MATQIWGEEDVLNAQHCRFMLLFMPKDQLHAEPSFVHPFTFTGALGGALILHMIKTLKVLAPGEKKRKQMCFKQQD